MPQQTKACGRTTSTARSAATPSLDTATASLWGKIRTGLSALLTTIRRIAVWLFRIRHRCGYGIHSPFAFRFVTTVIYSKADGKTQSHGAEAKKDDGKTFRHNAEMSCFDSTALRKSRKALRNGGKARHTDGTPWREKDIQMLRRVVSAVAPQAALVWSADAASLHQHIIEKIPSCTCHFVSVADETHLATILSAVPVLDFLYVDDVAQWSTVFRRAADVAGGKACFVVRGIHRNRHARHTWYEVCTDSRVRVTFDLYDFGIAFFEARLNKQDYIINYF